MSTDTSASAQIASLADCSCSPPTTRRTNSAACADGLAGARQKDGDGGAAGGTPLPVFRFGRIDDDRLAVAGKLITDLVTGGMVAPNEPWIRGYLGLPSAEAEAA